ncbi:MAG: oligosaccharide flippase family protein [Phycisphaerales bacterium JB063]
MSQSKPILSTVSPVGSGTTGGVAPAMHGNRPKGEGGGTLRHRAMRSGFWTIFGHGAGQVMRLASNIVLARLLVPADFGLMALVAIFMQALQMFSDIGIGPSIIQSKRGEDEAFLNTAFTIQAIRGFVLWIVACLIAYPVSLIWDPMLMQLLPVVGFTAVLQGFNSTALQTMNRRLTVGWITMIELIAQVITIVVMVGVAWKVSASVWALVAGGFAGAIVKLVMSHLVLPGVRNRFAWDRSCFNELVHFGRWLFLSTIVTFLAMQVNNLLYGALMSTAAMGVYWIGYQFAQVMPVLVRRIGSRVGFAALSELYRRDEADFGRQLRRVRLILIIPINLGLAACIFLGPLFIHIFYTADYTSAGWVIQVLAISSLAGTLNTSYGHAYMAIGSSFRNLLTILGQFLITLSATLGGYFLAIHFGEPGEFGFLLGIAASQWLKYPVDAVLSWKSGFWQWRLDFVLLVSSASLALLGLWAAPYLVHFYERVMM